MLIKRHEAASSVPSAHDQRLSPGSPHGKRQEGITSGLSKQWSCLPKSSLPAKTAADTTSNESVDGSSRSYSRERLFLALLEVRFGPIEE